MKLIKWFFNFEREELSNTHFPFVKMKCAIMLQKIMIKIEFFAGVARIHAASYLRFHTKRMDIIDYLKQKENNSNSGCI